MATIALAGGGTGGHVYPAIAIGDVLRDRGHDVIYYGDPDRLEGRVAPARGYVFRPVRAPQYPRSGAVGKVLFAWGLLKSIFAVRRQLAQDGVDLVLGVGGYVSAPPVLAAWTLGVGRMIHEANAVPGKANRLCGKVAQRILITYPRTRTYFPASTPVEQVGMPVDPKVLQGDRLAARARYGLDEAQPVVLFVGGSLGAAKLNELAVAVARSSRSFQVLHLTGRRYHEEVTKALAPLPEGVVLVDYEDRMGDAYAAADLAVCRAGSSTLAELCAVGLPSVLIPSPNVTENHQEENARSLEASGAAVVMVETAWDLDANVQRIHRLLADGPTLAEMAAHARELAQPDAAIQAADAVERTLQSRSRGAAG